MNPDTLRAHNALHGQTLLQEWQQRRALRAEGDRRRAEGDRLLTKGYKMVEESNVMYAQAAALWALAIKDHFGDVPVHWDAGGCTVAGERYEP